jgi:hypothetical protein
MLKRFIQALDEYLLLFKITLIRDILFTSQRLRLRDQQLLERSFHINYKNHENRLAELCHKFGSDKGSAPMKLGEHLLRRKVHNYADFYEFIFGNIRPHVRSVFECGIGTNNEHLISSMGSLGKPGASLRVWKEYFLNAQIFGVDIDRECLFEEDRISTFELDQTSPSSIQSVLNKIEIKSFDLIIDDGVHTFEAGRILFENLVNSLAVDGTYIIEDVNPNDVRRFEKFFANLEYSVFFVHLIRKGSSLGDNSVIVIRKR